MVGIAMKITPITLAAVPDDGGRSVRTIFTYELILNNELCTIYSKFQR